MKHKQVLLVRSDLRMPKGKIAAQCGHAAVEAALRAQKNTPEAFKEWRSAGMAKIAVKVAGEKELYRYLQQAKDAGLVTCTITDAGHTVVAPGTVTCGAIGPAAEEEIDPITGELPLL